MKINFLVPLSQLCFVLGSVASLSGGSLPVSECARLDEASSTSSISVSVKHKDILQRMTTQWSRSPGTLLWFEHLPSAQSVLPRQLSTLKSAGFMVGYDGNFK